MEENGNPLEGADVSICVVSVSYRGELAIVEWNGETLFEGTRTQAAVLYASLGQMLKEAGDDVSAEFMGEF